MAFIAAPVAAWAIGASTALGASAAVAAGVGALAGAVAVGVVSGAVMGAASALVTGQNILKGALRGAVVGGITAGVFSGLGMATGLASAQSQLASVGLSPTGEALTTATNVASGAPGGIAKPEMSLSEANAIYEAPPANYTPGMATPESAVITSPGLKPSVTPERGFFDKLLLDKKGVLTDSAGKIISGGVEGVAQALAAPEPESQAEYLQNIQNMNVAGDFQARVANIKIPDYWKRASVQKPMTPSISPQVTAVTA